jgi:PPOX class probable F420-dependent enzyme
VTTIIGDVITPGQEKAFTVRDKKLGGLKDLAPQYKQLLTEPVTAALTTVNDKGEMHVTPVWVGNDGTYLELNTARGRKKDRNLRSNGKVTLLFLNAKNPYHWMSINGKVVDIIDEDDKARGRLATQSIDSLALRYVNQTPYPFRDPKGEVRVLFKVEPTQILTFGNP